MRVRTEPCAGALFAKVNQVLTVDPEGHLNVSMEIEAENVSDASISLTKPYRIPMAEAYDVVAFDNNGDPLEAYHDKKRGYVEIIFKPNTVLPANHKLKFRVSYRTPVFGKRGMDNKFLAVFAITPQKAYKKVPIQNHRFTVQVNFEKPKPKIWWLFKGVSVRQEASQSVPLKNRQNKWDRTELHFTPFDLGRNTELRITFNYHYVFSPTSSMIWGLLSPACSLVVGEIIKIIFRGRI